MKKIITSLFLLLCVFGSPVIEIYAEGVQDDNPVENTRNNDENQHEDSNDNSTQNTANNNDSEKDANSDYGILLCSGNKGKK